MTSPQSLTTEERRRLLDDLSQLKTDEDDLTRDDPKWFLPLETHARAIRVETLVVRGGRGAGKSALFKFLKQWTNELGEAFGPATPAARWIDGFGNTSDHPSTLAVGDFASAASDDQRRFFWFGWLCARVSDATREPLPDGPLKDARSTDQLPARLAAAAQAQLGGLSAWLDAVERNATPPLVVTYDYLDRIEGASFGRERMTASLLAMWLALADRYRRLRPKVFVREDLFQASTAAFPDASKLDARSTVLEWRTEDLYRLLIKHMANLSDPLKEWLEASTNRIPLRDAGTLGWMPPSVLPETGRPSQKAFADHLAGEQMGSGDHKGYTWRWIPNRLQDAHARVVPRSMLSLVRNAASFALQRGPRAPRLRLLTSQELVGALEQTSKRRANELKEEFPVVTRLENLREKSVMLERRDVISALALPLDRDDEHGTDGEAVLRTLLDVGVMSQRSDGRIDVPDIYRYGFGILRKGGVKRPG